MFVKLTMIDGGEIMVNINHIECVLVDPESGNTIVMMDVGKSLCISEDFNQATIKLKYEGVVK